MPVKILLVEDEPAIRDMLTVALARAGLDLETAKDVREAEAVMAVRLPDLILLDWMLPGVSGIDFARRLKQDDATRDVPIIMLTARGEETDKIRGLDIGADDYVTKPFSPRELISRINAVLRRTSPLAGAEIIETNGLRLDTAGHRVSAYGESIDMGPTEYRLLHYLMSHPERVYSRAQLLDRVWGGNVYVEERTVDVHIRRLRKALSAHGHDRFVQTVRGVGYRFSSKV